MAKVVDQRHATHPMLGEDAVARGVEAGGGPRKKAATASIVKWTAWLAEGPGASLKKLHRFSRVATGWTESAKSKGESDEIGEREMTLMACRRRS